MANDLGAYLRRVVRYVGIGSGLIGATIALEPAVLGNVSEKIKSPVGIETRLQEAPKPPEEIRYQGGVAYAQGNAMPRLERIPIEQYYNMAREETSDIVPGMRVTTLNSQYRVKGTGFGFVDDKWSKFYIDSKQNMVNPFYQHLMEGNGKTVKVNGRDFIFDARKLIDFIEREHLNIRAVGFYGNFMMIDSSDRNTVYIIPLPDGIAPKIKTLDKG